MNMEPRHFAILPWDPVRLKDDRHEARRLLYRTKYGINPIFYTVNGGGKDHSALNPLLSPLCGTGSCDSEARGAEAPVLPTRPATGASAAGETSPALPAAATRTPVDPDDPQKGQWGGRSSIPGRRLRAEVSPLRGYPGWHCVKLILERTPGGKPLRGPASFHLHHTFYPDVREVEVTSNRAVLELEAWGAFTCGAEADNGKMRLELDLASDEVKADPEFKGL